MSEHFMLGRRATESNADHAEAELAHRDQALQDISLLMRRYSISIEDLKAFTNATAKTPHRDAPIKLYDPFF